MALLLVVLCPGSAWAGLKPGDPIPALDHGVSSAATVPPTDGRVVLLDFWASWCPPCKASFPALARLHRDYASRGFVIIAVGVDEKVSAHEAFLRRLEPPFFTLHDRDGRIVSDVNVPAMPTSYMFARDGRLRFIHTGFHGKVSEAALREQIESLLDEKE